MVTMSHEELQLIVPEPGLTLDELVKRASDLQPCVRREAEASAERGAYSLPNRGLRLLVPAVKVVLCLFQRAFSTAYTVATCTFAKRRRVTEVVMPDCLPYVRKVREQPWARQVPTHRDLDNF
ncbi:MAG: hypothetical protein M3N95_17030 [Actinomycetota bacterium]|nr:hypothetical protein [Actinomycetota bacterium]